MLGPLLIPLFQVVSQATPAAPFPTPTVATAASSYAQALSPDAKEFAFTVDDGTVGIAAIETGEVRLRIDGFPKWIDSVAWSEDGKSLVVLSDRVLVRIVRTLDGSKEAQFSGSPPSGPCPLSSSQVTWLDRGSKLLLYGGASPVQLRDRSGELIREVELTKTAVSRAFARDPVSPRFAIGDTEGNLVVCSTTKGDVVAGPFHVPKPVNALAFDPEGRRLAVGGGDCRVRIIALDGDAQVVTLSHCDEDIFGGLAIGCVAFAPDGKRLVSTSFSFHEVRLWDLDSKQVFWKFDFEGGNEGGVWAGFTPDGSGLFTSRGGGLHAAQDGKAIRTLGKEGFRPADQFRMDRDRAWNQVDGVLNVFDVASGKRLSQIQLARGH